MKVKGKNCIIESSDKTILDYRLMQLKNSAKWLDVISKKYYGQINIAFFGDSITWGSEKLSTTISNGTKDDLGFTWGYKEARVDKPYPDITIDHLKKWFPQVTFNLANKALPAQNSKIMYNNWFVEKDFDLVVICLGTNDSNKAVFTDTTEYVKWMSLLIEKYISLGSFVIICDSIYSETKYLRRDIDTSRFMARQIANTYGLPFMDFSTTSENFDTNCFVDWLHPTQHGHNILGAALASFLCGTHMLIENKNRAKENVVIKAFPETTTLLNNVNWTGKLLKDSPLPGVYSETQGNACTLYPGNVLDIPFYVDNDGLYLFPMVSFENPEQGQLVLSCGLWMNAGNGVYKYACSPTSSRWTSGEQIIGKKMKNSYMKRKATINKNNLNFNSESSFCLEGCIMAKTPLDGLIGVNGKGWQFVRLENTGLENIFIFGLEFMNEKKYENLTGVSPQRFTLAGKVL